MRLRARRESYCRYEVLAAPISCGSSPAHGGPAGPARVLTQASNLSLSSALSSLSSSPPPCHSRSVGRASAYASSLPAPRVLMDSHHAPAHPPTHPQIAVTITITFPSLRRPPVHAQAFPTLGPIPTHSGGRDRPAARVAGLHCRGKSLHHRHRGGGEGRAGSSVHQAGADALQ